MLLSLKCYFQSVSRRAEAGSSSRRLGGEQHGPWHDGLPAQLLAATEETRRQAEAPSEEGDHQNA